jgi:hypothetical protein
MFLSVIGAAVIQYSNPTGGPERPGGLATCTGTLGPWHRVTVQMMVAQLVGNINICGAMHMVPFS